MIGDLVAFLAARLDEDEAAALDTPGLGEWEVQGYHVVDPKAPKSLGPVASFAIGGAAHVARHDPARVLRDVAAKRAILTQWEASPPNSPVLTFALYNLAAVYSDHPDYRQEWKP